MIVRAETDRERVERVLNEVRRFDREVTIVGVKHLIVVFEGGQAPGKIRLRLDEEEEGIAYLYVDPGALHGEYQVQLWRELAVINAVNDPELVPMWAIPEGYADAPMSRELSIALLRRTLDMLVARVDPLALSRAFDPTDMTLLQGVGDRRMGLVAALALDVPLSLEMAGFEDMGKGLYANTVKGGMPQAYEGFREFVKRTRNYVSAYSYLFTVNL